MTDYNNGEWHDWNGGECPVHPESVVEVRVWLAGYGADGATNNAGMWRWRHNGGMGDIIAFRVVTPYVEPKKPCEFWAYQVQSLNLATGERTSDRWAECHESAPGARLFREVIK